MWIKSLETKVWININHIIHFSIVMPDYDNRVPHHEVYAFLGASESGMFNNEQDRVFLTVYQRTSEECEQFIKEQIGLQTAWQ